MASLLQGAGHRVVAPTLNGDGSLNNHVDEVIELVDELVSSRSDQLALVAHSYSGMVATEVARRRPAAISKVVYLDAFVPDRQCAFEVLPDIREPFEQAADEDGYVPPLPVEALGVNDPEQSARIAAQLRPWPLVTHLQPGGPLPAETGRSYIQFSLSTFFDKLSAELKERGWAVDHAEMGHLAPITHPEEVAETLLRRL